MDLLKILNKHPRDFQALKDAQLNIGVSRSSSKTWSARTYTIVGDMEFKQEWSHVTGYESPRRAVLHAIRAGVEARMKAAALFNQEKANAAE